MKGVILGLNPAARFVDLSHQVPPQDLGHAAFFLAAAVPFFPAGTIHVIVVDPGVGTARALLYVEVAGQRLLVPDNGCWTLLKETPAVVIRLSEPRYWRQPISPTFHGRDILAPVAGHLSLGLDPRLLGPTVGQWVRRQLPTVQRSPQGWSGEVVFIDRFGNLLTNIPGEALAPEGVRVAVAGQEVPVVVRTYAEAPPGTLVALLSSCDCLEIAVVQGSAAERLQARVGTPVCVGILSPPP